MQPNPGIALVMAGALLLATASSAAAVSADAPVDLGTAASFAVLAGTAVTNTGDTTLTGDLGVSPGTAISGFPPGTRSGTTHTNDGVAQQAQDDLTTAYNDVAGRTPVTTIATELAPESGQTLLPGAYDSATGTFEITKTLTLDAQGNASAIFIFKMASTLITGTDSAVLLLNGAQACNVYWQVGSSATLGTRSAMVGNILALTSIGMDNNATLDGRALARNGAVTLDDNTVAIGTCACAGPLTVTATAEDGPRNEVAWSAVSGATAYNVYRAIGAGTMTLLTTATGTNATDTDVDDGVTYRYEVTAILGSGETEACMTAEVTAIPDLSGAFAGGLAAIAGLGAYVALRRRRG